MTNASDTHSYHTRIMVGILEPGLYMVYSKVSISSMWIDVMILTLALEIIMPALPRIFSLGDSWGGCNAQIVVLGYAVNTFEMMLTRISPVSVLSCDKRETRRGNTRQNYIAIRLNDPAKTIFECIPSLPCMPRYVVFSLASIQ